MTDPADTTRVRVWDLPTRVFHWALVACVLGLFVTGKAGGEAMPWHARFGYVAAALLLFRVVWGFAGGHWSRFANFLRSPAATLGYTRGSAAAPAVGHNPLGALSVIAMLVFLLAQAGTGLFSDDHEEFRGPLNAKVSESTAKVVTRYHKRVGQNVLLALVGLHIAAIAWYRWRRGKRLVGPMFTGDQAAPQGTQASRDTWATRLAGLAVFIAFMLLMGWVSRLGGP
jgi:cytochrome b